MEPISFTTPAERSCFESAAKSKLNLFSISDELSLKTFLGFALSNWRFWTSATQKDTQGLWLSCTKSGPQAASVNFPSTQGQDAECGAFYFNMNKAMYMEQNPCTNYNILACMASI